jgi:AcrR family transcriptional regulator
MRVWAAATEGPRHPSPRPVSKTQPLFAQLKPRRNASREEVEANQRARLHAAMGEACARKGYGATTAMEVARLAGVSRKTLYKHFGSLEGCCLATYDVVVDDAVGRIAAAYRAAGPRDHDCAAGLCRAFDAFVAEMLERPKTSRVAMVDILSVGPSALERIERAEAVFVEMIAASLAQEDDGLAVSSGLIRPLIGGVWFVARSRLLDGEADEFADCGAELGRWLLSYRTAESVPILIDPARVTSFRTEYGSGGADERTRILWAAASLIARGSSGVLVETEIAELADVSPATFSEHFEDVGKCLLATLELLGAETLALALRESEGATSWAAGICHAARALCLHVATDRAFARAAFVEAYAGGPAAIERRADLMRGFANVLLRRAPLADRPSALEAEAIVGSVWSLVQRQVVKGQAHRLPALAARVAFLALAPIVGAEEALATITAELEAAGGNGSARRRTPVGSSSAHR